MDINNRNDFLLNDLGVEHWRDTRHLARAGDQPPPSRLLHCRALGEVPRPPDRRRPLVPLPEHPCFLAGHPATQSPPFTSREYLLPYLKPPSGSTLRSLATSPASSEAKDRVFNKANNGIVHISLSPLASHYLPSSLVDCEGDVDKRMLVYSDASRRRCSHWGASILYFFWKFNRNHMENDRYLQKNNFLLFAKCLKMYRFFRICILRLQKVLLWPKHFFSWKISIWVSKKRRILCWFVVGAGF